ncbi:MAG: hypothetical protein LBH46_01850 [Rickettsiales bacterium]|jgi:hypothetical protein|nr:hypothetical protein [Rickettsiales bacterium]
MTKKIEEQVPKKGLWGIFKENFKSMPLVEKICFGLGAVAVAASIGFSFGATLPLISVACGAIVGASSIVSTVSSSIRGIKASGGWKNLPRRRKIGYVAKNVFTCLLGALAVAVPVMNVAAAAVAAKAAVKTGLVIGEVSGRATATVAGVAALEEVNTANVLFSAIPDVVTTTIAATPLVGGSSTWVKHVTAEKGVPGTAKTVAQNCRQRSQREATR